MDPERGAPRSKPILVTGSTGYVGGRLVPKLLERGHPVRGLVREASRLRHKEWFERVEVVVGDALEPSSLAPAFENVHTAYYLIHSMEGTSGFRARDAQAAESFGETAHEAGVERIIYLGGLGDPRAELSDHLRSRQRTGEILRSSGISVTEFRAAVIIGSGSASFEMIRYLVEGLPLVVCPRGIASRVQPIAIRDVLAYLLAALERPPAGSQVVEIGGASVLNYRQVLEKYATLRGLRRPILSLPWMPPRLCARWIDILTPIPARLAAPLVEGLGNDVVVRDRSAERLFPDIRPVGVEEALLRALAYLQAGRVETTWQDSFAAAGHEASGGVTRQGMIMQRFERPVQATPGETFAALLQFGGSDGWGFRHPLWSLRRWMGRFFGGGRPAPPRRGSRGLRVDDVVDGWRVVRLEAPRTLILEAEGQIGGSAWTAFEVLPAGEGSGHLRLTPYFAPHGFWGVVSWYFLSPFRNAALRRVSREISALAETNGQGASS